MSATMVPTAGSSRWGGATMVALAAHAASILLVCTWVRQVVPLMPEPVVLVELPPESAVAQTVAAVTPAQPETIPQQTVAPPIDIPVTRAPLPNEAVTLPPPAPAPTARPTVAAPPAVALPAPARAVPVASTTTGDDPKARKQQADYFSLLSAHLNRRKTYPTEAKKARQQGVVAIRFTVDRNGNISGESVKRSSGHSLLDNATLDLLRRVAPLPDFPSAMTQASLTITLPIEYSLTTK